jgi:hypothetical protein
MSMDRDDDIYFTIRDVADFHMFNTEEYYAVREAATVQFAKEFKTLPPELSLVMYAYAPAKVFRVVDIEKRPHEIRVHQQDCLAWLMARGKNIAKGCNNDLQKLTERIAVDKEKYYNDNIGIEYVHMVLGSLPIDRSGIRPTVTLPKTGHKLDIYFMSHVNRITGSPDGWFERFGHCWGDEVQAELRELLEPMLSLAGLKPRV